MDHKQILDELQRLGSLETKLDTVLERQTGIAIAVQHWADETMALHERYREALADIGRLTERVAKLERRSNGSSPAIPAQGGNGGGQ
jgi:hypothetical protein